MTWLKLDDGFGEHPKVMALSAGAFRAHVRAMCWAARQETDGRIARKVASDLTTKRQRIELVQAGVWDELPDGEFAIHDFLEYNPSHAKLKEKRASTRRRVNAHRNGVTGNVGNDVGSTSPGPSRPDPVLTPDGVSVPRARAREAPPDLTDSESESPCPLDLVDRAKRAEVLTELADRLPAPLESLEHEAREFVSYWTIGGGTGKPRRHWLRKLREHLRKRHESGQLTAPGAIQHGGLRTGSHGALPHHLARLLPGGGR